MHTKGPWRLGGEDGSGFWDIWAGRTSHLARVGSGRLPLGIEPSVKESEANAKLIATAPELLEALAELLAYLDGHRDKTIDKAKAALRKAKGE